MTTALNINQERKELRARTDADIAERTPFAIGRECISQAFKRKLESKYGKPTGLIITDDVYTNILIDLANEYFGIDK